MSDNNDIAIEVTLLLGDYADTFINMVMETYTMLNELDEVTNDKEFWQVFNRIEKAYIEIESAKDNYYTLLKRYGGNPNSCYLTHELDRGTFCLDDNYNAIIDIVEKMRQN